MTKLSPARAAFPLVPGLDPMHRGKVCDTYDLGNDLLLPVVSDGLSVHDFVLNTLVPDKGYALNAMKVAMFRLLELKGIKTHLVDAGAAIDEHLPRRLRGNADLERRALVVRKLAMITVPYEGTEVGVEIVIRNCMTPGARKYWKALGMTDEAEAYAHLQDGDAFPEPICTPTTKSETGHDVPIPLELLAYTHPQALEMCMCANELESSYLKACGIKLADGKFEVGIDSDGVYRIGDETGTSDCCRLWSLTDWKLSRALRVRSMPVGLDKQPARDLAASAGIDKLDPENPEHVARAHAILVPSKLVARLSSTYRGITEKVTGFTVREYATHVLGVKLEVL